MQYTQEYFHSHTFIRDYKLIFYFNMMGHRTNIDYKSVENFTNVFFLFKNRSFLQ